MLLWYRDTGYDFDYTLGDSWFDPPSWGPKHALIVVDSHPFPYTWDDFQYENGQNVRVSGRVVPADATFTLEDTTPFTLRLGYDPATGEYVEEPLETKTFGPRPAVRQFHDSLGYYPGLWCCYEDYLYWWDIDASAVIPAEGDYSTRVTWADNTPAYDLYGLWGVLGSGNPGDDEVQFGLHIAVVKQHYSGDKAKIMVWNSPALLELEKLVKQDTARPGRTLKYRLTVRNPTPIDQPFVLNDPIPENTTFVWGRYYDPDTNSIHKEGTLRPGRTFRTTFYVRVDADTPVGTIITNEAYLADDALGDSAFVTTEVVE